MKIMKRCSKKSAFTLAEVLISLAIIGVVAALTIPSTIASYQDKALETQKNKTKSTLAKGIRLLMADDGVTSLRDTKLANCGNDKACIKNEIGRAFNVIGDNTDKNPVFDTVYSFTSGSKDVWNESGFKYIFTTGDGSIYGLANASKTGEAVFVADVNGIKNPNNGSKDLCEYRIDNKGAIRDFCANTSTWSRVPGNVPSGCAELVTCEVVDGNGGGGCHYVLQCESAEI